jgi:hypothetical protein
MNPRDLIEAAAVEGWYLDPDDAAFLAEEIEATGGNPWQVAEELVSDGVIEVEALAEAAEWSEEAEAMYTAQQAHDSFAGLAIRVEQDAGRHLTEAELDRLWEADQIAEREGQDSIPVEAVAEALNDTSTRRGRIDLINQRLADQQAAERPPAPEAVAPLSPDASRAERLAYLNARAAGAEVAPTLTNDTPDDPAETE